MNLTIGKHTIRPFVMVVPEYPEKTAFIQSHLKSVGIEAENFNGFCAVNPQTKQPLSGLRTVHPYELDAPGSGWNIGQKPVSLWVSFYMLWSAMNLLPEEHFWQLEWDCKFPASWRGRVECALRDAPPDFDLLFVGSCCCQGAPTTNIKGDVFEVKYPQCGHCIIIAKKALPVMLRTQRKVYAPLDISLKLHTLPLLKCYTVLPRIAEQFDTVIPP
jgi:hypothetical protein